MRALLVYPRFPKSFWSFDKTLELIGRKAPQPPLGLVTVAAILPDEWEFRLVDRNVSDATEEDWEWAEIVLLSGMIAQKEDFRAAIKEAKRRGKPVAVGGPYATSLPGELEEAGADFLVLDEGEITIPMFCEALERGETGGVFRSNGVMPDVTITPIPRFELLDLSAYSEMSVQFSRGCPFLCEFCDIIILYGRRPRTKTPAQLLAELDRLYELGWRRSVFIVDDNFIGNKKSAKGLLRELEPWMEEKQNPFTFFTEASVDLAKDQELMDMMTACRFGSVFLGIETPDEDSLALTRKHQNIRDPLGESIDRIASSGLRIMAGFIIGFDGEAKGAGERIVQFVEDHSIPTATYSMLQALPGTALTKRLEKEGRFTGSTGDINQTTLMNFVPTRPLEEIADEYMRGFWSLYDPQKFLDRAYRHYRVIGEAKCHKARKKGKTARKPIGWREIRALFVILFRQGVVRKTRYSFWPHLWRMFRHNRGGVPSYLGLCGHYEHFFDYRQRVNEEIGAQLEAWLAQQRDRDYMIPGVAKPPPERNSAVRKPRRETA
ncbi:MAG: DUF4070 domain-containing protein [Myxococcota bacterium]